MREFKGRVVTPGTAKAEAVVTHGGFNTLASLQKSLQFGDKTAKCNDQNNPDLYGKPLAGYALCLPQTIGSTTGGMVLYCACAMKRQPACMLFANPIDSLAAAGAILADVWLDDVTMPVVDSLGEEFLDYVKDGDVYKRQTLSKPGFSHRPPSKGWTSWRKPRASLKSAFCRKKCTSPCLQERR